MTHEKILENLFCMQDKKYRDFQIKLLPTIKPECMIGVRTPELRNFAKKLISKENCIETQDFISSLPHTYFDENQLHAFILSAQKDFDSCIKQVCRFLPFVDNWATCDQLLPKIFKTNHEKLLPYIDKWIKSSHTYTIRFGIGMLMQHFLDADFSPDYLRKVVNVESCEYYVNMMRAWYMATALAKQYDSAISVIENHLLDDWTHRKAIQKAIESYRISSERKDFLKQFR